MEDESALWLIFAARMFQGIWTGGQQAIEQSYVSEVVRDEHKLKILSEIGISAVLGFVTGPVFGTALAFVDVQLGVVKIDKYTSCGYLQFILTLIMMFLTLFVFREIPHSERHGQVTTSSKPTVDPPNIWGITVCMIVCFIVFNGFAVQETITTPLVTDISHVYSDSFDWDVTGSYLLFTGSGIVSILSFVLIHKWEKHTNDKALLLIGLSTGVIGYCMIIDYSFRHINIAQFIIGFTFISISFPVSRNMVFTIISKILGPNKAGCYMGWMLAVGAIARMAGPFWAVQSLSVSLKLCFGGTGILFLLAMLAVTIGWKELEPHSHSKPETKVS